MNNNIIKRNNNIKYYKDIQSYVTLPLSLISSYFIWYIWIIFNFPLSNDISLNIWLNSICMSLFIGTVLNANAYIPPLSTHIYLRKWSIFRFYIIPLCVSSYSSVSQYHSFKLLFPVHNYVIGIIGICLALFVFIIFNIIRIYLSKYDDNYNNDEFNRIESSPNTFEIEAVVSPLSNESNN